MTLRDNWRIVLLTILVVASGIVLFVPGATLGSGPETSSGPAAGNATGSSSFENVSSAPNVTSGDGLTNLQYGIQLEGGSRIRAPISGMMVDELTIEDPIALEENLSAALGIPEIDVEVRRGESEGQATVEVFNRSVSDDEFASALAAQGYSVSTDQVQNRVSDATRQEMISVIKRKVSASALSGVSVQGARTPTGNYFVVIESVGRDIGDLQSILQDRGVVNLYAYYPAENGTFVRRQVLEQGAFKSIGNYQRQAENDYLVPVTLNDEAAGPFQQRMREVGFDKQTICNARNARTTGCIQAELNGDVVFNGSVRADLAELFRSGDFAEDPQFSLSTTSREEARNLEISLKTGQPLPAPLNFTAAQTTQLEPSLADRFKANSVVVGLAAVLTVSLVVYYRYRDARVAAPMVVTALSEVFLLLGFVALIQYPLNLAHIAGFIAVIGTGVDDLVIIADEVLQQEGVTTGRVFRNRFRKAFWVIGAAAATTILAMSPLMVLSLGDLSGFAIITIVGVLLGIGVTRPAYGDILRNLILDD